MVRRNKYVGENSCYAMNEGVYVPKSDGVVKFNFPSIIALIIRDYKRGFSYDDQCREIPFDKGYAEARGIFAGSLAHTFMYPNREEAKKLMDAGRRAIRSGRLPPDWVVYLSGRNAGKLRDELVRYGIVSRSQVVVIPEEVKKTRKRKKVRI